LSSARARRLTAYGSRLTAFADRLPRRLVANDGRAFPGAEFGHDSAAAGRGFLEVVFDADALFAAQPLAVGPHLVQPVHPVQTIYLHPVSIAGPGLLSNGKGCPQNRDRANHRGHGEHRVGEAGFRSVPQLALCALWFNVGFRGVPLQTGRGEISRLRVRRAP